MFLLESESCARQKPAKRVALLLQGHQTGDTNRPWRHRFLAVLGLSAVIAPHRLEQLILQRDMVATIVFSIVLFIMGFGFRGDGRVNRWEGALLLFAYLGYLFVLCRSVP